MKQTKSLIFSIVTAMILLAFSLSFAQQSIVELELKERCGVNLVDEPVLCGVPLPKGAVPNIDGLALVDQNGNKIPCEFRVVNKWYNDTNSIKWVHLDFLSSVNANQTKKVFLNWDHSKHSVTNSKLTYTDNSDHYLINTGKVKFTVKKSGFNIFDELWVDQSGNQSYSSSNKIIESGSEGIVSKHGTTFFASNLDTVSCNVSIERWGTMAGVILADYLLKPKTSGMSFYVRTRIYVYNNSSKVRVVTSADNKLPPYDRYMELNGLTVKLNTTINSSTNYALGDGASIKSGALSSSQEAYSYTYATSLAKLVNSFGGAASGSLDPIASKSPKLGWASLYNGEKGVAFAYKWFWQLDPSSVEVKGNGAISVGFFPERQTSPIKIYSGVGRTHEVMFNFFNSASIEEQQASVIGIQRPLIAAAPTSWYTRTTKAFGKLVEKNSSLFSAARATDIQNMESGLDNGLNYVISKKDARAAGFSGFSVNAYGYLEWGDGLHYSWTSGISDPGNFAWNGNYYDLPHMAFTGFIRTRDYKYLDVAVSHTNHIADVHTAHFTFAQANGACRYCPATEHVKGDPTVSGDWTSCYLPHIEPHTSHHKGQSSYENWYLTANDRSYDIIDGMVSWLLIFNGSMAKDDNIKSAPRRVAHVMHTLYYAYMDKRDPKVLAELLKNADGVYAYLQANDGYFGGAPGSYVQDWMIGYVVEAFLDVYELTGDITYFRAMELANSHTGNHPQSGIGYAAKADFYNNTAFLDSARAFTLAYPSSGIFNHVYKDYALKGRNLPRSIYYFAIPDSADLVFDAVSIENTNNISAAGLSIEANPNPFNPSVKLTIRLTNNSLSSSITSLNIYSVNGKLIKNFIIDSKNIEKSIVWNGKDELNREVASGSYFAVVKTKNSTIKKRLTFLK